MKFFTNVLRWLLGLGAFIHGLFAMGAVWAPDQLTMLVGIGRLEFSYVWIGQAGMLMFTIALMSLPAAYDPRRFRVYAWLIVAGTLLEAFFWYYVRHYSFASLQPPTNPGVVFAPFEFVWIVLGVTDALLVLFLVDSSARFSVPNIRETIADWRQAWQESNDAMFWFGCVVFTMIVFHIYPIVTQIFFPKLLTFPVGSDVLFHSEIWIALAGVEILVITLLFLPAALAPTRYYSYAWLTVAAPLISAVFWFWKAFEPLHHRFVVYAILNLLITIPLYFLLQQGAPPEEKATWANGQKFLSFLADTMALQHRSNLVRTVAFVILLVGLAMGWSLWYYFIRAVADTEFASDEMNLKYGAVGLSLETRVPYYLFDVLPDVFPELIPDGKGKSPPCPPRPCPTCPPPRCPTPMERFAAAVGVIVEPSDNQPVPIGFSVREIGFKAVEPNCGLCHVATFRTSENAPRQLIYGAPNHALDIQAYQQFLYNAALSPNFTSAKLMAVINKKHKLGFLDEFYYRFVIIPFSRGLLLQLRSEYLWQTAHNRAPQGRGRTDTFNTTKLGIMQLRDDGRTSGTTDLPQVWQLGRRHAKKMWLHWDGNNSSIPERNYTAAMAVGASSKSVMPARFDQLIRYLWRLAPAPYPLTIDKALAARGKQIFLQPLVKADGGPPESCADCHSWAGNKIGQVTQPADTDPWRSVTFTTEHCKEFKRITYGPTWVFPSYRKLAWPAYVNVPLDGLWTRGPYLHHGAVPTLYDLLQPVDKRPKWFYRGYDVLNPVKVGFVSDEKEIKPEKAAELGLFRYDTTLWGNSNKGHEYGTNLPEADKLALIEYLKTDDGLLTGYGIVDIPKVDTTGKGKPAPCEAATIPPRPPR